MNLKEQLNKAIEIAISAHEGHLTSSLKKHLFYN
jgi:hypothetical protein